MSGLSLDEAVRRAGPAKVEKLAHLLEQLPPLVARKKVAHYTGGLRGSSALARDDQAGRGPRVRVMVGQQAAYPREYLVEYLERLPNAKGRAQEVRVIVQQDV